MSGRSLTLAQVPSIGIDPAPKVKQRLHRDAKVVKATSDDFFARPDPLEHFRDGQFARWIGSCGGCGAAPDEAAPTLDLVFIDGMHLFEYALRDFMNVERHCTWTSVIVFDDMLPRDVDEAARDRHTKFWAGDVFKVIDVLRRYRPELVVLPIDTEPTGTLVVMGADHRERRAPRRIRRDRPDGSRARSPQSVPEVDPVAAGCGRPGAGSSRPVHGPASRRLGKARSTAPRATSGSAKSFMSIART